MFTKSKKEINKERAHVWIIFDLAHPCETREVRPYWLTNFIANVLSTRRLNPLNFILLTSLMNAKVNEVVEQIDERSFKYSTTHNRDKEDHQNIASTF